MAWQDFTQATIIPPAGDNTVAVSPTGSAAADLVSAATNVNGVIITGVSLSLVTQGTSTAASPYLRLLAGGVIQLEMIQRKLTSDQNNSAIGGLGSIEVPAGQAISYESNLGGMSGGLFFGFIRITWRHKV